VSRAAPVALAAAALLAAAGCGGGGTGATTATTGGALPTNGFAGQAVLPDAAAADFALHDQDGRLVRLSALKGRTVLLTFLYTRCRDVCPTIAVTLDMAAERLGAARDKVRIVAVSVDPEHDTRRAIREFVRLHRLGPEFRYLSGTSRQLRPVWQAYNVLAMRRNSEVVDHSAPTLLIDASGRPRVYYGSSPTIAAVVHDLRRILRQS
jgi:protein SCO1